MYHKKIIASILDKHAKNDVPYTAESEYELEFRSKDKKKPWGVATIYHPTQNEKHNKIQKIQEDGYKFYENDKLTIIAYNSIKNFFPLVYKNHTPKPMLLTEKLILMARNSDKFKDWGCNINCVKSPCY